jgi:hypothetical protein
MQEIAHIAFFDPASIFDDHGKLLSIHQMPEYARRALVRIEIDELYRKDSNRTENIGLQGRVRWGDKLQALKTLAKCLTLLYESEVANRPDPALSPPDLHRRVFGRFAYFGADLTALRDDDGAAADADDLAGDVGGKVTGKE